MKRVKKSNMNVLCYTGGTRRSAAVLNYYLWRAEQDPKIPERCDNISCIFYSGLMIWNNEPLKLILDHINGVNTDNRPKNLRLLCPNCDSQNINTRGGANKGKVIKYGGGFAKIDKNGRRQYVLPAETTKSTISGGDVKLEFRKGKNNGII